MRPRRGNVVGTDIEAVDTHSVVGTQRGSLLAIATTQMHHQPAGDTGPVKDFVAGRRCKRRVANKTKGPNGQNTAQPGGSWDVFHRSFSSGERMLVQL
jgi:hypothetical protein